MIKITIFKNGESYIGFDCIGHAGYNTEGNDIICAGVSALAINAINSLACLSDTNFETSAEEETGKLIVKLTEEPDSKADLLMRSLVLGLQGIQDNYGNEYIQLNFKEV